MSSITSWREQWTSNVRVNVLAGITATLALVPDSLAFSFMAGVPPVVGIYASICILLVITFLGGRPGMISAAAGSMAVLMLTLVKEHGIEYLFAATVLTGVIQLLMGVFKLGKLMRFVPSGVLTGFINALAIMIFLSQLRYFKGESWVMYVLVAVTLGIIYLVPRFFKAIPSPLIAVVVLTLAVWAFGMGDVTRIGDIAKIDASLPSFLLPDIPFSWETLWIILPYSLSLAVVGYTETMLTHNLLDEMTGEKTDKNREMKGQGIANIVAGFFGGMAGCALVAESVLNVKMGGKNRLSTLVAALFLLLLVVLLGDLLSLVPMAALVGIMLMVCIAIFDWSSVFRMNRLPLGETVVMAVTVGAVLLTHDLAVGVIAGVFVSFIWFAVEASKVQIHDEWNGSTRTYRVQGQLFFASASELEERIEHDCAAEEVRIDLTGTKVWDHTANLAVRKTVDRLQKNGKQVTVVGV
ncbi:SulP family inorganic anion transporter [Paenibacillus glycanilyticus]|uniref:SulP family inorganic anion transporter n=1 Tax=Paenibacillus glycanilyticus TaxID=126569 RepID=UPI0020401A91|nr:SulP family inorganic anion transporter [Paenibacillus glycanilyticus]MCM3630364.1 SulP family inorganic anion transporter [Paenibacillus glycanilyticus]